MTVGPQREEVEPGRPSVEADFGDSSLPEGFQSRRRLAAAERILGLHSAMIEALRDPQLEIIRASISKADGPLHVIAEIPIVRLSNLKRPSRWGSSGPYNGVLTLCVLCPPETDAWFCIHESTGTKRNLQEQRRPITLKQLTSFNRFVQAYSVGPYELANITDPAVPHFLAAELLPDLCNAIEPLRAISGEKHILLSLHGKSRTKGTLTAGLFKQAFASAVQTWLAERAARARSGLQRSTP